MKKRLYIVLLTFGLLQTGALRAEVHQTNAVGLTLDSCLELARRNNPSLRKAELDIKRAEQVKMQAFTNYFPKVQGNGFAFHALYPVVDLGVNDLKVTSDIGSAAVRDILTSLLTNYGVAWSMDQTLTMLQNGYLVGVTAVQPVFMGGKIIAGNQLAKVGVEAARLKADIAQRDELEQIEQTYWLVYGLQLKQTIVEDATHLLDTLYHSVETAVSAGLALPADLSQVQLKRDEVETQRLQLYNGIRLARQALALSIGLNINDSIIIAEQQVELEAVLPADSAVQGAEEHLLNLQIKAATLERNMALADALPQIVLGANYSYGHWQMNLLKNGLGHNVGNGALFVTLNVPLTGWWETGHKLKEKQYAIEQARIDQQFIGSQLALRNKQAYDRMIEAAAIMQMREKTVAHAQEAYDQTRAHYEAGLMTISQVLQAQTSLTQAKADWTDAQIAYRVLTKRYRTLTGRTEW